MINYYYYYHYCVYSIVPPIVMAFKSTCSWKVLYLYECIKHLIGMFLDTENFPWWPDITRWLCKRTSENRCVCWTSFKIIAVCACISHRETTQVGWFCWPTNSCIESYLEEFFYVQCRWTMWEEVEEFLTGLYAPVIVDSCGNQSGHFKNYIFKYLLTNMAR